MDDKPWLAHYDRGVPATLHPYPAKSLCSAVAEAARERPDVRAVLFKGAQLSWQELYRQSVALATSLRAAGVAPGDRVTLLMPNCPQFIISQLAA
ncbi:MAG: AMP-binding protein, partial [Anaerolineae bacterium]|nr:AMP-binding protein [Anaerolineae bacterium]